MGSAVESLLDYLAEGPGALLVLLTAHRNPGVDETQGLRRYPYLMVALPPRWTGNGSPDLVKHVRYPVQGCQRPDGEACALPEVARVRGRQGSAEATHDQVVIRVVYYAPNHHVIEHMTLCSQDVVGPGAHLMSALVHGSCLAVLQPRLVPWEKVAAHVL